MTTALDKSLKRELGIGRDHYTLTISPEGLKLVPKGKRNGVELKWLDLVSGQAALAVALNASLSKVAAFPVREERIAAAAPETAARKRPAASAKRPPPSGRRAQPNRRRR